jgi:integrase
VSRYSLVTIKGSPNWYVQWFEGGHSRRCSTRTSSRDEAEAFLAAFRLEAASDPEEHVDISTLLDWYLDTRGKDIAAPARAVYAVSHLKAFFGSARALDIGPRNQGLYVDYRRSQGVKDETIRRELGVLSAALNRAVKQERLPRAPAVMSLEKSPAKERWLSRQEAALILRHFRQSKRTRHLLLFTRLALFTGSRSGAILDLTWDRVDLERKRIWFPLPGRQTTKRRAVVPLEANMLRALAAAKRKSNSDHVISWRGKRCERIVKAFRSHMRELGLNDVTPHTLRHTFATWAAQKGVSLFLIGRTLGHSNSTTTDRYAKHQPDALREVTRAVRRK